MFKNIDKFRPFRFCQRTVLAMGTKFGNIYWYLAASLVDLFERGKPDFFTLDHSALHDLRHCPVVYVGRRSRMGI
jgi:hypothetical protein